MPADPFANRRVPLAEKAGSRFRLAEPVSVAGVLAGIAVASAGAGYSTDDCALIRSRLLGQVVGGEDAAVLQDLDYERRHCRR